MVHDASGGSAVAPEGAAPAKESRRVRVVASTLAVVALMALVAVRVGGDGGQPDGEATMRSTTSRVEPYGTGSPLDEPFAEDTPSGVTDADLDGIAFTDVAKSAGLAHRQSNLELESDLSMTSGAAAADVDRDGDIDLYVTRVGLANSLYRNDGDGTFTDIAAASGVDRRPKGGGFQGSGAAAFADVDADGCVDLYVAGMGDGTHAGEAALFMNDCNGGFTDETQQRGLQLPTAATALGAQGHGVTFGDYDHDGFLDLLVLHWDPSFLNGQAGQAVFQSLRSAPGLCELTRAVRDRGADRATDAGPNRSRLFHNDGTGSFTDVTAELRLPLDQIAAFTGDFVDVTGDGWEDLVIAGDICTSTLFRNDQGKGFTDITAAAGVGTDENGMGSVVRDMDGDGDPDWFVTSISALTGSGGCTEPTGNTGCSGNRVYLNRGDGTFDDATDQTGLRNGWWGWGAAIEDFGNHNRLSVAAANGFIQTEEYRDRFITDPLRFWVPRADKALTWREAASPAGLTNTAVGHALVPFDYDGDGDLDLFVANFGDPPNLYRNDVAARRHSLTVRLDDATKPGNRSGVGSKVRVSWGGSSVTGWISTGGSYETQRVAELHVGLGTETGPVTIEVWWPGAGEPQRTTTSTVDRVVTISRR